MQFVYVERDNPKCNIYLKAEDPEYVSTHNLTLDSMYYLNNQLLSPVALLLDPVMGKDCKQHMSLDDDSRATLRVTAIKEQLTQHADIQRLLRKKELQSASRTRVFENKKNKQNPITRFMK